MEMLLLFPDGDWSTLLLSLFLSYIFGLMGLLWSETLCLSLSLSED